MEGRRRSVGTPPAAGRKVTANCGAACSGTGATARPPAATLALRRSTDPLLADLLAAEAPGATCAAGASVLPGAAIAVSEAVAPDCACLRRCGRSKPCWKLISTRPHYAGRRGLCRRDVFSGCQRFCQWTKFCQWTSDQPGLAQPPQPGDGTIGTHHNNTRRWDSAVPTVQIAAATPLDSPVGGAVTAGPSASAAGPRSPAGGAPPLAAARRGRG